MNREKWRNSRVPLPILALKLCEEAAEVGTEMTDVWMKGGVISYGRERILNELEHVEFIASVIRARLTD